MLWKSFNLPTKQYVENFCLRLVKKIYIEKHYVITIGWSVR